MLVIDWNASILSLSAALIPVTKVGSATLLCNCIVRRTFLRLIPPAVLVYSTEATAPNGIDFTCIVFISMKTIRVFNKSSTLVRRSA